MRKGRVGSAAAVIEIPARGGQHGGIRTFRAHAGGRNRHGRLFLAAQRLANLADYGPDASIARSATALSIIALTSGRNFLLPATKRPGTFPVSMSLRRFARS